MSPLAPAVVLLLSAFVLSIVLPRLPAKWLSYRGAYHFIAPGLVGLAILVFFDVQFTLGSAGVEAELEQLSKWRFSASEAASILGVRANVLSLYFLILTLLILLIMTLITLPLSLTFMELKNSQVSTKEVQQWRRLSGWLTLGAAACFVFVAANTLTLGYAILFFDALLAFYWLQRDRQGFGVARLFLGVLTISALSAAEASSAETASLSAFLVALSLWLRLGLYPFIEMTEPNQRSDDEGPAYLALSLSIGIYLAARTLNEPLPTLISGLTIVMMLLNGLLAWLGDDRLIRLVHLILATGLLILPAAPLAPNLIAAFSLGLVLSFAALWLTARLSRPQFNQKRWFWPYLPALAATLTLIGVPFSLGWPSRLTIYDTLLISKNLLFILLAILAEALAFSGLVRYWLMMWQDNNSKSEPNAALGYVAMVPFLVPGLATLVFSLVTTETLTAEITQPMVTPVIFIIVVIAAIALGYFKEGLLARIEMSPAIFSEFISLRWLFPNVSAWLGQAGKLILRMSVIVEGQHYIGWAIFAAIVGTLIILLRG